MTYLVQQHEIEGSELNFSIQTSLLSMTSESLQLKFHFYIQQSPEVYSEDKESFFSCESKIILVHKLF